MGSGCPDPYGFLGNVRTAKRTLQVHKRKKQYRGNCRYYARTERAALDILEQQEPVDKTIILWWGLDGLRLNEDGTLEWVSKRKPKPVQEDVFYQPFQSIQAYNQTQSTRASIDALMAQNVSLQMQAYQAQQIAQLINSMQQCCVQYPAQYPPYFYGGCCGNYVG